MIWKEFVRLMMFISVCLLLLTIGIKLDIIAMNQRAQMQLTIQEKR